APARAGGLRRGELGRVRGRLPRQDVPTRAGRPPAARAREEAVGPHRRRDGAGARGEVGRRGSVPLTSRLASPWRTLTHGPPLDAELDEEIRATLEALTRRKIAEGLEPEAARREAAIALGGVDQVEEATRDARIGVGLETAWRDARYAWRALWRSPGFALATI